jgi:hypothetical protein
MIRFPCPTCGKTIKAPEEAAGKTGKCRCGGLVRVPTPNPFDQAMEEQRSTKMDVAQAESRPTPTPTPKPAPAPPLCEMIFCYACRKSVADNAPTCPKCGAVQTPEGREKGRQIKKQANTIVAVAVCVLALPVFMCCLSGMFSGSHSSPQPEQRVPAGWDMEKLRRDAEKVARDPSRNYTVFIPKDGSQPIVIPHPKPLPDP